MRRAAAILLATLGAVAAPTQAAEPPPATPGARAAIVVDARNGEVMFAKHAGQRRQIASTTKLMTALLTLENTRPRRSSRPRITTRLRLSPRSACARGSG